jgi:hypothetical protein
MARPRNAVQLHFAKPKPETPFSIKRHNERVAAEKQAARAAADKWFAERFAKVAR